MFFNKFPPPFPKPHPSPSKTFDLIESLMEDVQTKEERQWHSSFVFRYSQLGSDSTNNDFNSLGTG